MKDISDFTQKEVYLNSFLILFVYVRFIWPILKIIGLVTLVYTILGIKTDIPFRRETLRYYQSRIGRQPKYCTFWNFDTILYALSSFKIKSPIFCIYTHNYYHYSIPYLKQRQRKKGWGHNTVTPVTSTDKKSPMFFSTNRCRQQEDFKWIFMMVIIYI